MSVPVPSSAPALPTAEARPLPAGGGVRRPSARPRVARLKGRSLVPLLAALVIAVMVLAAVAAPLVAVHDPTAGLLTNRLRPPFTGEFVLGTDALGRDIFSRLVYGARITVLVGIGSVLLAGLVGVVLGLVAGFFGGWVDRVVSACVDIQMSFPFLCLAIALVAVLGTGLSNVIVVLAVSGWVLYARIVRAEALRLRSAEFVQAGRALGATNLRLILGAILPNVWASVIVVATFTFAQMVIAEASLSYLGVGIQPPTPTWGGMLSDGQKYLQVAWWLVAFPGGALLALVLAVNLLGDWLRDVLDPRLRV